MKKLLKEKKFKAEKGGFTLVELIVVLVILAILAALLIPALTGYIDKAREKQVIAEARQAVMATQTLADEAYAANPGGTITLTSADIAALAEVKGTVDVTTTGMTFNAKGVLQTLTYTAANGKICVYKANPAAGEETYTITN